VSCEAMQTEELVAEHDSGGFYQSWMPSYYEGHTMVTFCEKYSNIISCCCSDESAADLGEKIANGGCGGETTDDEGGSSASTIKDAIKEVVSYWDGEAELYVRDEEIYIHQAPNPNAEGVVEIGLVEGINLIADSLNITDINPDTVNFLTVHWNGGEDIVLRDEKLIARFGEKPKEMEATKYVVTEEEQVTSSSTTSTTTDDSASSDSTTDTTTSTNDETTQGSDGEIEEEDTTATETKTVNKVQEVPVETYEEALVFAYREWGKIKRDDGHTIEAKIVAGDEWQTGRWALVHIPSFDEDEKYMYVTKVSHSEEDGWECNVTLTDYPPSFGDPPSSNDEETTDEETTDETTTDDTTTDETTDTTTT